MNKEEFIFECSKLGVEVTPLVLEKLNKFYKLLISWNEKINLTSITEEKDVYLKHFYDSLTLCKVYNLKSSVSLCDVGSGAGFPGIVLKIFFPNLDIVLVDSLNKRVNYLNFIIKELDLKNIVAVHSRIEDYSKINENKFDIITFRAVASISFLSEASVRALKVNGKLIFMKGNAFEELQNIDNICSILFLKLIQVEKFNLPFENSARTLIVLEKEKDTNKKYPRDVAKIKKNPL